MKLVESIQRWPLTRLSPYAHNARIHSAEQVAQIAESIKTFGFNNPILVDAQGGIIAGHGRFAAATKLGLTEAPVILLDHLTDRERRAYIIADNKLAENATWDDAVLAAELAALNEEEFDLSILGFDDRELEKLLATEDDDGRADECPPVPEAATTVLGDLWLLGRHRVLCGDATDSAAVARVMAGAKADMVFTDPPYNADYSSRVDKQRRKPWGGILNDAMSPEDYDEFIGRSMRALAGAMKTEASVYCCIDWKRYPIVVAQFAAMFTHKATIVWNKGHFGLGTYYRTQYELVLFGTQGERPGVWNAGQDERDVWLLKRDPVGEYVHPTQKPVEVAERAIGNSSRGNDNVMDLFGGSGSTLIACEKRNRDARLLELDPKYCDVIVTRWQDYAGKQATLDGDGRTFAEVRAARLPTTK
jgi:DNA modification methylase